MRSISKCTSIFAVFFTFVLGVQHAAFAQPTPVAATMSDQFVAGITAPNTPAPSVNCDMLEVLPGRTLKAIVWDDKDIMGNLNMGYFMVEDHLGTRVIQSLPWSGTYELDVVLGNNMSNPNAYKMGIVCRAMGNFYMFCVYDITNVGGALNVSLVSVAPINSNSAAPPHVDMWSDFNTPINGRPSMHEMIVTGITNTNNLFAFKTDIMNPQFIPATLLQFNTSMLANSCDVAAFSNTVTNDRWIVLTYTDFATNNLRYIEYNTTLSPTANPLTLQLGTVYYPRVEAMSRFNPAAQNTRWEIVAVVSGANGWQIRGYNPMTPPTLLSTAVGWPSSGDYFSPAVAAGVGFATLFPNNIANRHYITGFYKAASNVWSRNVNALNGTVNPQFIYAVNATPISPAFMARHYAVSSCSNTGLNILSAWFSGTRLWYKESPNAMSFKPTGIDEEATELPLVKLYPNPATDRLFAKGIEKKCTYTILDISGRKITSGNYENADGIDVHSLLPGTYILQLNQESSSFSTRFVKK